MKHTLEDFQGYNEAWGKVDVFGKWVKNLELRTIFSHNFQHKTSIFQGYTREHFISTNINDHTITNHSFFQLFKDFLFTIFLKKSYIFFSFQLLDFLFLTTFHNIFFFTFNIFFFMLFSTIFITLLALVYPPQT